MDSTNQASLEGLPPELRNYIYELALQFPFTVRVRTPQLLSQSSEQSSRHPSEAPQTNLLALTAVSKPIRHDTLQVFFNLNHFIYEPSSACQLSQTILRAEIDWLAASLRRLPQLGVSNLAPFGIDITSLHRNWWQGAIEDFLGHGDMPFTEVVMRYVGKDNRGIPVTRTKVVKLQRAGMWTDWRSRE